MSTQTDYPGVWHFISVFRKFFRVLFYSNLSSHKHCCVVIGKCEKRSKNDVYLGNAVGVQIYSYFLNLPTMTDCCMKCLGTPQLRIWENGWTWKFGRSLRNPQIGRLAQPFDCICLFTISVQLCVYIWHTVVIQIDARRWRVIGMWLPVEQERCFDWIARSFSEKFAMRRSSDDIVW